MPKPIVNNQITYQNSYGRIIQFEQFLNQGVRTNDSPTFANIQLTGDATIEGNLYVEGNTTILDTNVIEFQDNIILINRLETGAGVTLNQSGFEVERGTLENYRFVYNEPDQTFRIGVISDQQAVATREDTPLSNGIMTWNNSTKRLDATNTIVIDTTFSSTTNSISSTTGCLKLSGGLGIKKDLHMDGTLYLTGNTHANKSSIYTNTTTNSLNLSTSYDINLTAGVKVKVPYDIPLTFGSTDQKISSNSANDDLNINANGNINLSVPFGKRVSVPNQIPIIFSTTNEKIYADDSNNMIITGSQDIRLTPAAGKKVLLPVNIPLAFNNSTQYISANLSNDLNIVANNNIYLTPGNNLNVILPYDNGIKFGSGGLQRIYANSSNELYLLSTSDLYLNSSTRVKVPVNVPLTFGNNNTQYIRANTSGNLLIDAGDNVQILNTKNSTSINSGAFVVSGGMGVEKDVFIGGNLTVQGNTVTLNTETILVEDNLIIVNNSPLAAADGGLLVKRFSDGLSDTTGNVFAAFFYKESTDEFTFAYTNTASSALVDFSDYIPIRANDIHLMNSIDATSFSSGSITTLGGGYIHKSLIVGGNITSSSLKVDANGDITNLNSTNITTNTLVITSTENATNLSTASVVINSGVSINNNLLVNGDTIFYSTTPSTSKDEGSLLLNGGMSIKCSVNSSSFTDGGALTIAGGLAVNKDIYLNGELTSSTVASFSNIILKSTDQSINATTGNIVSYGGISINNTTDSVSSTNGGSFTSLGGGSFNKDLFIGETLHVKNITSGTIYTSDLYYTGNGAFKTLQNTSGSSLWNYIGKLNNGEKSYCEIDLYNGTNHSSGNYINGVKLVTSINGTNQSYNHNYYGDIQFDNTNLVSLYIYTDTSDNTYLFCKLPPSSVTNVHVKCSLSNEFAFNYEGVGIVPDGSTSTFDMMTWIENYNTSQESNLSYKFGDLAVEGVKLKTASYLPVIGYNNINSTSTRDIGLIMQRYQQNNDTSSGDVITDNIAFSDTLPNQSTLSSIQIKLSNSASAVDNHYQGWWIKVTSGTNNNQVRRIVSYNGSLRVAELENPWTTQNPSIGDTINLYALTNAVMYYDESESLFKFGYCSNENDITEIINQKYGDVQINKLILSETQSSHNLSSGSLISYGGISINNTTDSVSLTNGGTFTSLGGASFGKKLRVGDSVYISNNTVSSSSDLHIKKSNTKVSFENDLGNFSYIDFIEADSSHRYGILNQDNVLSLTYNNSSNEPNNSNKYLNITTSGNIGINTTSNINSLLTMKSSNAISTDKNDGFIEINGGKNNTSGASIVLYGDEHLSNPNNLYLETNSTGSIYFTNDDFVNVSIDQDGNTTFYSNLQSSNSSSGSVVLTGGLSINCNTNASSITQGGAVTIAGGACIKRDLFVGEDVFVDGNLTVNGLTSTPTLTFSNTQGCSIVSYNNCKLININNERILSFGITITPNQESANCQFQFDIPARITNFLNRTDLIVSCSGYTDDTELYTLFNTLGVAVSGTTRGLIKFHSASTGLHNLSVMCRYTV